jgi:hypothetical protein
MDRMPTFESAPAPSLEIEPVEDMPREENKKVSIGLEKETPFLPPKKEQTKAKKPMSEKQQAHMERMRQRRMELQAARTGKKFEKKEPTPNKPKETKTKIEEETLEEPPKKKAPPPKKNTKVGSSGDDFEKWLDNYEMLKKMEHAIAQEEKAKRDAETRKKEEEARKELEMEERIRKKILAEQKQKNMKVAPHRWTPQVKTPIPSTQNHLQTPTTDYGIYSNRYF